MALVYGIKAISPATASNKPFIFGFTTARTVANDTLFEAWNGSTNAARKAVVDLDGKYYSAALTAGDLLYAVAGGVSGVKRLDSLAIGTAFQVLQVNSGATAPQWTSSPALTNLSLGGALSFTGNAANPADTTATLYDQAAVGPTLSGLNVSFRVGSPTPSERFLLSSSLGTAALFYDGSNYFAIAVSSAGAVTLNATGASAGFSFSDLVTAAAGLTVSSGQTLTVTGATVTGLTAASVAAGIFPAGSFSLETLVVTTGITIPTGASESAPGLIFSGDANTGLFHGAADSITMAVGGVAGFTCEVAGGLTAFGFFNAFGVAGAVSGSGNKVVYIPDTSVPPSGSPTGGGVLYVESGALKYKGSGGTVTPLASA